MKNHNKNTKRIGVFQKLKKRLKDEIKGRLGIFDLQQDVEMLRARNRELQNELDSTLSEFRGYARVDGDVGIRGNNTIILTGVIRNRGYVRFYDMGDGAFKELADQMHYMRKRALVRHIDEPGLPQFKAAFNLED